MLKRLLVTVLVLLSVVTTVAVTRGAAGVPQDLQALTAVVENGFAAIQRALSDIQNSLNSLGTAGQSNVRFTPPVFILPPDSAVCFVVNVSTVNRSVHTQLVDRFGSTLNESTLTVQPGAAVNAALSAAVGAGDFVHCNFTVVGGSRTDIRAALNIHDTPTSDRLSVPAE